MVNTAKQIIRLHCKQKGTRNKIATVALRCFCIYQGFIYFQNNLEDPGQNVDTYFVGGFF